MTPQRLLLYLALAILLAQSALAGDSHAELGIENLMTASEFKDAGLVKLSPEELAKLNKWLTTFASKTVNFMGGTGRRFSN